MVMTLPEDAANRREDAGISGARWRAAATLVLQVHGAAASDAAASTCVRAWRSREERTPDSPYKVAEM